MKSQHSQKKNLHKQQSFQQNIFSRGNYFCPLNTAERKLLLRNKIYDLYFYVFTRNLRPKFALKSALTKTQLLPKNRGRGGGSVLVVLVKPCFKINKTTSSPPTSAPQAFLRLHASQQSSFLSRATEAQSLWSHETLSKAAKSYVKMHQNEHKILHRLSQSESNHKKPNLSRDPRL